MNKFLSTTGQSIIKGSLYKHYSGNIYEIIGVGKHTETRTEYVIYKPKDNDDKEDKIWIRPLDMFLDEGTFKDDSIMTKRFEKIK